MLFIESKDIDSLEKKNGGGGCGKKSYNNITISKHTLKKARMPRLRTIPRGNELISRGTTASSCYLVDYNN